MILIQGAEDLLGHQLHLLVADFIDGLYVLDGQDRVALHVRVAQGDALGALDGVHVVRQVQHRRGPEQAIDGVHGLGHAQGIGQVHIAGQRIEVACPQHDRIGGGRRAERQHGQALGLLLQGVVLVRIVDEQGVQGV